MEIAIVDACGGQYGHAHGSIHIYEIDDRAWDSIQAYALTPDETMAKIMELEETDDAELKQTIVPDDVVTV